MSAAGTTSRSPPCDLSRQFPCRTSPHICIELSKIRDGRSDCPDGSDEECPEGMHRCVCGLPRCIERNKVGDGIKHCQDGSDEGEDGSNYLCPESSGEENLFAVEMKKRRRRHAAPRNDPVVYPTGLISTFVGTEVNGDLTTLHTTQRYRTYVDGSYTELLQSTSMVQPTPTMEPPYEVKSTANVQRFGSLNSGKVYLTAVNEPVSAISSGPEGPIKISGTFIPPEGPITTKNFGLDLEAKTIDALKPGRTGPTIITVTGTKGTFISPDSTTERIFPVYTGSYISGLENPTTYKFFFGNHPLTSDVEVILPTSAKNGVDISESYEAEESELKASVTGKETDDSLFIVDSNFKKDVPEPFYRPQNKSFIQYDSVPTSRPDNNPVAVTRFVQPTAYPETDEPVIAVAGRNTIGIVGNIRKPSQSSTLRGHHGHYRQGRMYNPSPTGRRIGQNGPTTVVADQYFFPGHRIENLPKEETAEPYFNNGYYDINDEKLQDQLRRIVKPTAAYERNTLKDSRLTRTVGLYGPIYGFDDLKGDTKSSDPLDTSLTDNYENGETKDVDFTTTLFGFADFSTRISGTQYIFLPASTRPRTFTPRVTRTSFTNGIPIAPRSQTINSKMDTITESFFRKPLFGTETREFISQNSMFTSTIKEPVEIQKTMFTSTVMTKQMSETNPIAGNFDITGTKSSIAETLPLNLDTVYESESLRSRYSGDRDLFFNVKPIRNYDHITSKSMELEVSEIIDAKEDALSIQPAYPTGLVSSVTGTEVNDGTTTHWTTLILGTYIDNTYAHVIESTSSIFFTVSKTMSPEETFSMDLGKDDESFLEISSNKLTNGETLSSDNNIELKSSLTDLSSKMITTSDDHSNVLSTPDLEILTSGFILPRNGRNNDFGLTSSAVLTETSAVSLLDEISSISEDKVPVTPGVVYSDEDYDAEPVAETSDEELVHIITDSFILPSAISAANSFPKETSSIEVKERDSTLRSKVTSTYLNDLDRLIIGLEVEENANDELLRAKTDSTVNIEENKSSLRTDKTTSKLVFLTGDFILPSAELPGKLTVEHSKDTDNSHVTSVTSESILTDGFILPSNNFNNLISSHSSSQDVYASPTASSLSILTDGFILPGVDKVLERLEPSAVVINALPSSALLTAEFSSDNELNEIGGRSAGENEKIIIFEDTAPDTIIASELPEISGSSFKEKLSSDSDDESYRLGKSLYSVEESVEKPKADQILPSISFPITYFTTSTYFTTYLLEGSTVVSSRKETVSHVYTDSEHLKLAKINPTETIIMPDSIQPTKTEDPKDITTFSYYTTFYKDGRQIVSSRVETDGGILETSQPVIESQPEYPVLTYPTTYYTTLTYFTTLLKGSTSEVISSETVVSNVVTPVSVSKENVEPTIALPISPNSNLQTPTTYFTTYTYYTTFHKDGTTSVSTNYQTVSNVIYGKENVVSTPVSSIYKTESPTLNDEYKPTTFYTTYTYYTTYLRAGSPIVSSREETVSSVGTAKATEPVIITTKSVESQSIPRETTYYTTYTYYTTLLKDGTTTVSTRKDTVSNIIQNPSTISTSLSILKTDTTGFSIHPTPHLKSYFTTYTYYTTFLRDGKPVVSTRESTVTNIVTDNTFSSKTTSSISPTRSFTTYFTTLTSYYTLFNAGIPSVSTVFNTLTDVVALETPVHDFKTTAESVVVTPSPSVTTYYTTYTYFTKVLNSSQPVVSTREFVTSNVVTLADSKSTATSYIVTPYSLLHSENIQPSAVLTRTYYTTYTFFTTYLSKGTPSVSTRLETVTNFVEETASKIQTETSKDEIILTSSFTQNPASKVHESLEKTTSHPLLLHLSTFDIQLSPSNNIVKPSTLDLIYATKQNEITRSYGNGKDSISPSTVVNTVYTTFTYYTTLFPNGVPSIQTRHETKSNMITVTIAPSSTDKITVTSDLEAAEGGFHENRVHPTPVITYFTTHTYITTSVKPDGGTGYITRHVVATATVKQDEGAESRTTALSQCCTETTKYPYTFYTTYTYYTTRFHGEKPIINTRYETITNVIKAPATAPLTNEIKITSTIDSTGRFFPSNDIEFTPTSKTDISFTSVYEYGSSAEKDPQLVKFRKADTTNSTEDEKYLSAVENIDFTENAVEVETARSTNAMFNASTTESPIAFNNSTENTSAISTTAEKFTTEETTNFSDSSSEILTESNIEMFSSTGMESTTLSSLNIENSTEVATTPEIISENTTEAETTTKETTTSLATTEAPARSIFSRRRNRPQYKPRPSFRSSSTTSTTTLSSRFSNRATTTTTTTRPAVNVGRRNATRLLYRRPSLAPRINPLQRFRPLRTTPSSTEEEGENSRKRRSFFKVPDDYDVILHRRKLLSTSEENNDGILKNNDLISENNRNSDRRNDEKENYPLGLIRSMEAKAINNGMTTVYGTEIHGTFINGVYAQVVQSKVRVYSDTPNEIAKTPFFNPSSAAPEKRTVTETNKVGLVSSKVSTAVRDHITTVYTTNVYGTYIGDVYAHLAQTTSNIITPTPTTQNIYPTGLISSSIRSEENYGTTTLWTTHTYGTFVNNYYAHIASTFSNVFVGQGREIQSTSHGVNQLYAQATPDLRIPTATARSIDSGRDYETGLLSSIVSEDETDGTTTQYITNIYGTYIGDRYAKHAQTTSKVILPTKSETSTRSVGLLSTLVNSVISGNTATIYKTEIFGTYIGQVYAQLARTSTEYSYIPKSTPYSTTPQVAQKTGLLSSSVVRSEINAGTTTMHINEIYGTYIGNAYAHIAKSTSKVIKPTQSESKTTAADNAQRTGLISSSVKTEVNDGTTTLHTAEVHGTYVGNYYAHVARRTSSVLPFVPSPTNNIEEKSTNTVNLKPEGLVSSVIRTEINQGTTTLHTREIHGTFINGYYAHVARSSSNIIIPTMMTSSYSSGLVSAITNSEINNGVLTLHTTEIYGTVINGFYAHIARSTSNVISSTPTPTEKPLGVISATTATEINNGDTTLHRTSIIGLEVDGTYMQSIKVTSSVIYASYFYPENSSKLYLSVDSKTTQQIGTAKDDLDTARVNELDNGNQYISLTEDSDLGLKTPLTIPTELELLSPSIKSESASIETSNILPSEAFSTHIPSVDFVPTKDLTSNTLNTDKFETKDIQPELFSTETVQSEEPTKTTKKEEKPSKEPSDDYSDYNDFVDNKTFRDKDSITAKPNIREQNPRKNKAPTLTSSRKVEPNDDYDEYAFEDDYDSFDGRKHNRKSTPSLTSSRFKNTRESKRKSATYGNGDYDDYDDEDYDYHEGETLQEQSSKTSESAPSTEAVSSSVRIRPFIGRGRPTYTSTSRSSTKASFTIQFRRPSRTRNSRAFGHRSDSENDFDDDLNEDEEEGDIEASEAVVTTATPQALSFTRRKPFGNSRYQPPGRNSVTTSTSRPVNVSRNRRPFGRSTPASPSPTPSLKDTVPDYDENTTEDDEFDDYDDFGDKKDPNRNRNFRSTRRPPSRITRYGERRSASNKRGSFRHREEEETENDDFDTTTPNYRNSRNRINQRKPSRGRYNRNNSPLLKSSFNSVSRDEDEDSQSLQPINRIRGNNRNRRPSYNPRTRRPSKTVTETPTIKKPYLTVTSVVTTVKTLPIYHGFRTSYATLTTTALDTSIIHPTQYSEVESDGVTKTIFYSKTGYPDGFENLHTTITEVVVTTTTLASVKLVPIKIGFSTRTDTITDIQVLTTLSTIYSTIMPEVPQPTAFPQQFQPNFYPQLGPQNPDFGLIASANSFVTTQIVTSTTVVPIILRGRTILSTLTTTSTAESIVVQTVRLPQVPSPAPYIPQPYFAFQPLTTLLTLYVTGEHGELKPVVTTVTVPLYQQPVFHTKVARSLQQNAVSDHTLKTADIMDLPLSSSITYDYSRDVDIDTHYDKLLSSGLEEINDLFEKSNSQIQTEPLDSTRISNNPHGFTTYDVTTISKGPLTEIYEQKVTINLNTDDDSIKQNEIDRSEDIYGLESRYSFRKLHQFIEEEPIFRPQRDFTRLRRPPAGIILATAADPDILPLRNTQSFSPRGQPQQFAPPRRPPVEIFNDGLSEPDNFRNGVRELNFARRPLRRPIGNFRPFIERPSDIPPSSDEDINRSVPSAIAIEPSRTSFSSENEFERIPFQNGNRNSNRNGNRNTFNGFVGSPSVGENDDSFQPISNPRSFRHGPAPDFNELNTNSDASLRSRRLRITRPLNGELTSGVVRRITRVRSPILSTVSPSLFDEDLTSSFYSVTSPILPNSLISSSASEPSNADNTVVDDASSPERDISDETDEENITSRRTVIRRLRPSFIPGDGSGARRPLVVRRTRLNDQSFSSGIESTISASETQVNSINNIETTLTSVTQPIEDESLTTEGDDNDEETINGVSKPPVKKIIRLRKPENGEQLSPGQRRRVVISRKPQDVLSSNTLQARGPINSVEIIGDRYKNNIISDKNHLIPDTEHDIDDFNKIVEVPHRNIEHLPVSATKTYPITYYTTLTYLTTFLHGPETHYASRVAVFSNIIDQTINPSLINAIKLNHPQNSAVNRDNTVHLASRTLGDTTTVVNLASRQNIYNSELNKLFDEEPKTHSITSTRAAGEITTKVISPDTSNINAIASLRKTYLTLFTYSYTFFDGTNRRESTRAETMTKVEADPSQFLTENVGTYIDKDGLLNVLPITRTLHLGSREVEGTTTEVNLGLKTLIKLDNIKHVVIETAQPFQYITPTRTHTLDTFTSSTEIPKSSTFDGLSSVLLESSYASANDLFGPNNQHDTSTETAPLVSSEIPINSVEKRPVIKVTSVIHKQTGSLRSGVFNPRPGVRVRVRPVVSKRIVPSDIASSFDISFDVNEIASEYPGEQLESPQYIPPGVNIGTYPTPVLEEPFLTHIVSSDVPGDENELVSEYFEEEHMASTDGGVQLPRKKLKVTVRRPQSESVSRTHTRFVLPSRFEITSKPRFYVVTRTGALGPVSNSQRPFTVKISRKLKPTAAEIIPPSTTVIYDTYTTLTSVPVIFGLDTSFRNVILTTSSPITVSFVPSPTYETDYPVIMPSTVILTYFTTTTFTIPYVVDDQTLFTTLEETNSRVVTSVLDEPETPIVAATAGPPTDVVPTLSLYTSIEFGFDGPVTHTLSSHPFITTYEDYPISPITTFYETPTPTLYETKTFYTTYTFFTTLFAGTDPVVSSSEQVISNEVIVPVTTGVPDVTSIVPENIGPVTVFDTRETVITKTNYNTVTFYATLFSDTSSFVTPIEEIQTDIVTQTETFTITRTIVPTPPALLFPSSITISLFTPEIETEPSVVVTQTLYTTFTNFVTLFQGTDTVVTNLEEVVTNVVTMTVPAHAASSFTTTTLSTSSEESYQLITLEATPVYTTREVVSTQTHYLTLFNNDESLLSSIEEVVTNYVTEIITPGTPSFTPVSYFTATPEIPLSSELLLSSSETLTPFTTTSEESTTEISTYHPELVPSIRTIYSTLTFYTTYYSDTSSIVATQEEILTSFVTLFVPPSLITSTSETATEEIKPTSTSNPSVFVFTTTDYSTLTLYTTLFSGDEIVVISSEHVVPEVITATITPSSISPTEASTKDESVLTFLTTFTYYTTYFSGTDPVIASSESVVTQFVTIEAPPTPLSTTELSIQTTPVDETIIGISTATVADIRSSYDDISSDIKIIGISSAVASGTTIESSIETKVQIESKFHTEIGSSSFLSPVIPSKDILESFVIPTEEISFGVISSISNSLNEDSLITSTEVKESIRISETPISAVTSASILTERVEIIGIDGKITSLLPSDTLLMITGTDGFVTKIAETEAMVLSPVYIPPTEQISSSSTSDIKPATVIELSDLLSGNTAFGGDIGLAIKDIVSLITGKKNKTEEGVSTERTTESAENELSTTEATTESPKATTEGEIATVPEVATETTTQKADSEKDVVLKDVDYPIFVLPSSEVTEKTPSDVLAPVYIPTDTISTSSIEKTSEISDTLILSSKISKSVSTSVITGARTVFIIPTKVPSSVNENKDKYVIESRAPKVEIEKESSVVSDISKEISITSSQMKKQTTIPSYGFITETEFTSSEIKKDSSLISPDIKVKPLIVSSMSSSSTSDLTTTTPELKPSIGTKVVSGARTVFFEPALNKVSKSTLNNVLVSTKESILGRANAAVNGSKSFTTLTKDGQTVISRSTSGATTIFFPGQIPKYTIPVISTRYITSIESITRTLALTTTRTYYTRDSTLTVPSVYTTTIPPRTFVSTIIGSRTILGILPEPTETVHIHKTLEPSERTTTVTTTTLIFNSIPSTVTRTLVLPTGIPANSIASDTSSSYTIPDANVFSAGTERPAKRPDVGDSTVVVIEEPSEVKESAVKPVLKARNETYLRAANPRIHDDHLDMRLSEEVHRPPIVVTEAMRPQDDPFLNGRNGVCDPKCQPYKKEVCKENDGLWTCQCRPGHARRDDHDICKEIQTFVVLLKVVKIGNDSIQYNGSLADNDSPEFKEFARNAREGIADAYSITTVKDHIWDAEVNEVIPVDTMKMPNDVKEITTVGPDSGVIVNFTMQVSKSVSGNLLEQELTRALQLTHMRIGDSSLLTALLSQSVQDYDECLSFKQNDCSLRAKCINLEGSFSCECNEGFEDMNTNLPGRTCLAKIGNCDYCHGRGDCLKGDDDKTFCRCQPMFVGRRCEINGLVLAVALPTAVAVVILLLCAVLCCCRKCKRKSPTPNTGDPGSVFRGIALKGPVGGTLDRKAMIDTSSESSGEHGRKGHVPFDGYQESGDVTPHKSSKRSDISLNRSLSTGYTSPPVMIPRAKQPQIPNKPMNYTVYDGQVYVW